MAHHPHLLSPGRIGTLELKNRLFQTAMGTNLAHHDGSISEESIAFYAARAAGGAALLTMGAVGVAYPRGQVQAGQVGISDDRFLPGLKRLTDAVHRAGGRVSAQLHHGGTSAVCDMAASRPIPVPSTPLPQGGGKSLKDFMFPEEKALSPLPQILSPPTFKEMDKADIGQLIEDFASGAARAVEAGFDAIEIHGAHTYILNSFISPAENRRTDEYGGSAENRARLLKEVIEAIRNRVGRDFPMLCKLNAAEFFIDGGLTLDDVRATARIAETAGADAITVSAQHNYAIPRALFSSYLPQEPGKLIPLAAAVKAAVSIPVVTVGRIDPAVADRAIAEGKFDFMAMGRKQIADDQFANHLARGGAAAVRPCIYCYACLSQAMLHLPLRCAVNADVGFEKDNLLAPAETPRRVVVVGGGPGGMEAARRLTLRGHQVILLEASRQLGGTARIAAIAYAPNGDFVDWLKARLDELGVDVRLNTCGTVETIRALEPDAVIVATGAVRRAPPIEGKDLPHVHDRASLRALLLGEGGDGEVSKAPLAQRVAMGAARTLGLTNSPEAVRKASKLWMPVGERVVIIGGDLVGLELAEFLHERGRHVTVVDEPRQFGRGLSAARRSVMLDEMPLAGIVLQPGARDIRISQKAVSFVNAVGEACEARADTVIIAKGAEPDTRLYDEIVAADLPAHMVGDCAEVGYIIGAVRTAADVAAKI
ncbi:FAD-dependent oxidoreductase [Phenylobacterium sp. LjRoot225]|uniref:oxidoreductase n=1 Tax=Phenylobacterium sp. LjRoot225 TaxID=3342285 RepID=UPI003ECC26DE